MSKAHKARRAAALLRDANGRFMGFPRCMQCGRVAPVLVVRRGVETTWCLFDAPGVYDLKWKQLLETSRRVTRETGAPDPYGR